MAREKIWLDPDALAAQLAGRRAAGARIVTANGCFDLLHVGHVSYLEAARELGDVLVVLVNTDASMARIKPDRTLLVPDSDRMELLAAFEAVPFDESGQALLRGGQHVLGARGAAQHMCIVSIRGAWGVLVQR